MEKLKDLCLRCWGASGEVKEGNNPLCKACDKHFWYDKEIGEVE